MKYKFTGRNEHQGLNLYEIEICTDEWLITILIIVLKFKVFNKYFMNTELNLWLTNKVYTLFLIIYNFLTIWFSFNVFSWQYLYR